MLSTKDLPFIFPVGLSFWGLLGVLWLILVPEEVLTLGFLLAWCLGGEHRLERVGVIACVPHLGRYGHRRGGEVLHLLELEAQLAGDGGQLGHILLVTPWVRRDEVGDDLLVEMLLAADAVELALELEELLERRLAHEHQHAVAGVLRRHLQTAADVSADELARVLLGGSVGGLVLAVIEQQVVAYAAADEALLDAGQGVDGVIDIEQLLMVRIQVGTDLRMDATGTLAPLTGVLVAPVHAVHIGAGTAEVGEVTLEVGHLDDLLHLLHDALLGAAADELTLMGGDGAEGASAETAAMDVDAELNHVVGGNALTLVLGVRLTGVGQVERGIELLGSHRRVGGIDDNVAVGNTLKDALGVHHVRLLLDVTEVLSLCPLVAQTLFVAVQHDVVGGGNNVVGQVDALRHVAYVADGLALAEPARQFDGGLFAHTVGEHIGPRVDEDARPQAVLPVVVVGDASQRRLDASKDDGHIGEELLEYLRIDDGGVFRPHIVTTVWAVGVLGAQSAGSRILVNHRVHAAWCDAEEQARTPQLLEVAVVAVPVGLRHNGDAVACSLKRPSDDGCAERRVIDIGIAREQDDVNAVAPSPQFQLLLRRWQEVRQSVLHLTLNS